MIATVLGSIFIFTLGLMVGKWKANRQWRANANQPFLLAHGEWLYKVKKEKRPKMNAYN